jgi:GT2 family glycosyltransferase
MFHALRYSMHSFGLMYTVRRIARRLCDIRDFHSWQVHHWGRWKRGARSGRYLECTQDGSLVFSVVVPVFNPCPDEFRAMLLSVLSQTWKAWELCLGIASLDDKSRAWLETLAARDKRITCIFLSGNQGIAANTNATIHSCTGHYVAFLDQDDLLLPTALEQVAGCVQEKSHPEVLYSDEAQISREGLIILNPHFKPDFSPELLLSHNYICHLLVVRRDFGQNIGWLRLGYDGAQDHDLVLRLAEAGGRFEHIPDILYLWRRGLSSTARSTAGKPWVTSAMCRAVQEALDRRAVPATASLHATTGNTCSIRFHPGRRGVSIIIPDKDQPEALAACVDSLFRYHDHLDLDIVIVDTGSESGKTLQLYSRLTEHRAVRIVRTAGPFNFSSACNAGAASAEYPALLFLNNDTEARHNGWLSTMLGILDIKGVGAVGAKLLYPDERIQHAGVVIGKERGGGMHLLHRYHANERSFNATLHSLRNVTAVTGACILTPKSLFFETGGFDPQFPLAYNDVDYCLRLRKAGYRIVWSPESCLLHHESLSRGSDHQGTRRQRLEHDTALLKERWQVELLAGDPYYNPNYRDTRSDYTIQP